MHVETNEIGKNQELSTTVDGLSGIYIESSDTYINAEDIKQYFDEKNEYIEFTEMPNENGRLFANQFAVAAHHKKKSVDTNIDRTKVSELTAEEKAEIAEALEIDEAVREIVSKYYGGIGSNPARSDDYNAYNHLDKEEIKDLSKMLSDKFNTEVTAEELTNIGHEIDRLSETKGMYRKSVGRHLNEVVSLALKN